MRKKLGLASALAVALTMSAAPAAFAADSGKPEVSKSIADIIKSQKPMVLAANTEEPVVPPSGKPFPVGPAVPPANVSPAPAQDSGKLPEHIGGIALRDRVIPGVASASAVADTINNTNKQVNANTSDIGKNTQGIAGLNDRMDENDSMNDIQNAAIDKNTSDIASHSKLIDGNRQQINHNSADISQLYQKGGQAIEDMNQNIANTSKADRAYTDQVGQQTLSSANAYTDNSAIQTLNKANAYTDQRYNQLNGSIKKLRSRVDTGVSGATAIGSLAFDTLKKNSFAGGLGVAKDKISGAIGYQRNFTDHWRARATMAFGLGDNYVQGGTSVGYSW